MAYPFDIFHVREIQKWSPDEATSLPERIWKYQFEQCDELIYFPIWQALDNEMPMAIVRCGHQNQHSKQNDMDVPSITKPTYTSNNVYLWTLIISKSKNDRDIIGDLVHFAPDNYCLPLQAFNGYLLLVTKQTIDILTFNRIALSCCVAEPITI